MSDEKKDTTTSKHVAPHWVIAGIAIVTLAVSTIVAVRSDDLHSLHAAIESNSQAIASQQVEINKVMSLEAVQTQRLNDLLDLLNRYVAKRGGL